MSSGDYLLRDEKDIKAENEQLRQEVEDYKLKEKICSECEAHPEYLKWIKENERLHIKLNSMISAAVSNEGVINLLQQELKRTNEELDHARKSWLHIQKQSDKDTEHIIKADAENEQLKAENEQLRKENERLDRNCVNTLIKIDELDEKIEVWKETARLITEENEQLRQELQQAKDMLRKCSPFTTINEMCLFCGYVPELQDEHKPNCEYIHFTRKE